MANLYKVESLIDREQRNNLNATFADVLKRFTNLQTQLNNIAVEGDSSLEAAQARIAEDGTVYPTLKARLDEQGKSILDRKFTRKDLVTSEDDYLLDINDLNESTRAILLGLNSGEINAVLGANNVKTENLAAKSVTGSKISDSIIQDVYTINLLDYEGIIKGGFYAATTGNFTADANYNSSPLIGVEAGAKYIKSGVGQQITFWNENLEYVTGFLNTGNVVAVPNDSNIKFMRFPIRNTEVERMVLKGEVYPNAYIPYRKNSLGKDLVTSDVIGLMKPGFELIEKGKFKPGYFNYQTGEWTTSSVTFSTDYIPVTFGCIYKKNLSGSIVYFDKNYNFIKGQNSGETEFLISDVNTHYVVLAFNSTVYNPDDASLILVRGLEKRKVVNSEALIYPELIDEKRKLNAVRMQLATSKTFLKIDTPYDDGTEWEGRMNQLTHPSIHQFETEWNGYKYWMGYTPYPFARTSTENPCIAVSNDGLNWITPPGVTNPLDDTPAGGYSSDTHLFYNASTQKLELWWRSVTESSTKETLWRRTTSDGVNWTGKEEMLVSSNQGSILKLISPSLIFEDNKYKMWFMCDWFVYYAESNDGFTWNNAQKVKEGLCDIHSWHPNVIKYKGTYYMLNCDKYTNQGNGGTIKYSTSKDGLNWSKQIDLITYTGNEWDYNGNGVYRGSLLFSKDKVSVYYGMYSHSRKWTLGLATGRTIDSLLGYSGQSIV